MALLISIITFLTTIGIVFGVWFIVNGGGVKQDVIRQRLAAVRAAERRGSESPDLQLVREEVLSTVPQINRILLQWSWVGGLQKFIYQAGLTVTPSKILMASAVLALGAYIAVGYISSLTLVALLAAVAVAGIPLGIVALIRRRRLRRFEENFPEALDLLSRAVRAGHAFTTGLELIASECTAPLSTEFRTTFEEQNLGLPLRDSLLNLTERVPLVDVRLFVTALLIQKETGGNLAEIVDELARVIRERFRIYRDVNVKTAQGRLTAGILVALPVIMVFVLEAVNPSYMAVIFNDPAGRIVLMIAAGLQIFGALLLWRIVHIEV